MCDKVCDYCNSSGNHGEMFWLPREKSTCVGRQRVNQVYQTEQQSQDKDEARGMRRHGALRAAGADKTKICWGPLEPQLDLKTNLLSQ